MVIEFINDFLKMLNIQLTEARNVSKARIYHIHAISIKTARKPHANTHANLRGISTLWLYQRRYWAFISARRYWPV